MRNATLRNGLRGIDTELRRYVLPLSSPGARVNYTSYTSFASHTSFTSYTPGARVNYAALPFATGSAADGHAQKGEKKRQKHAFASTAAERNFSLEVWLLTALPGRICSKHAHTSH
jgi:hypothetical protein